MIVGSVVVAVCLLILGWTKEVVGMFIEDGDWKKTCTIWVAVLSIYAVDFAINAGEFALINGVIECQNWWDRIKGFQDFISSICPKMLSRFQPSNLIFPSILTPCRISVLMFGDSPIMLQEFDCRYVTCSETADGKCLG